MTITLSPLLQKADDVAGAIFRALRAGGREHDAMIYAGQTWNLRDPDEAVQTLLRLCEDITVVWQEAA